MFFEIIIVSVITLLIGTITFAKLNRKSSKEKSKERNTKLFAYIVITTLLYVSIAFVPILLYIITAFLIFVALREILVAAEHAEKRPYIALMVSGAILYAFAHFIKNTPPETTLFTFFIVIHFDAFSQLVGETLGSRKMIPKISPMKTWEGFWGGFVAALIAGFVIYKFNEPLKTLTQVTFIVAAALAGDLLASWYKRICGVKNYSTLIPGHGGVIDRFDSFFMAGALFQLLEWFYSH